MDKNSSQSGKPPVHPPSKEPTPATPAPARPHALNQHPFRTPTQDSEMSGISAGAGSHHPTGFSPQNQATTKVAGRVLSDNWEPLGSQKLWPSVSDIPSCATSPAAGPSRENIDIRDGGLHDMNFESMRITGLDLGTEASRRGSTVPSFPGSPNAFVCNESHLEDTRTDEPGTGRNSETRFCVEVKHTPRDYFRKDDGNDSDEYNPDPQPIPGLLEGEVRHNPVNFDFLTPPVQPRTDSEAESASTSPRTRGIQFGYSRRDRIVLVMVGLPARGKSHISRKIQRFMEFFHGVPSRIFNIGSYRRKLFSNYHAPDFFDAGNPVAMQQREQCLNAALTDLHDWVDDHDICCGILDATNTTRQRRDYVLGKVTAMGCKVIFCESIVTDEALIDKSIVEVKTKCADFQSSNFTQEEVLKDFRARIRNYEKVYEPIDEKDPLESQQAWIKIINTTKFKYNHIYGTYPCHILKYLMSCHLEPRTFYLVRHGQTEYDAQGKIGGDSPLTPYGDDCAKSLAKWMKDNFVDNLGNVLGEPSVDDIPSKNVSKASGALLEPTEEVDGETDEEVEAGGQKWSIPIFTSTLTADNHMADELTSSDGPPEIVFKTRQWRNLDQVYAGDFDGKTASEIRKLFPEELEMRKDARLTYRYPRGESVADLIMRLENVINAMEQSKKPIIVIAHHAVLNVIYAYWKGIHREQVPSIRCTPHRITKLTVNHYDTTENIYSFMTTELPKQIGSSGRPSRASIGHTRHSQEVDFHAEQEEPEMCLDDGSMCVFKTPEKIWETTKNNPTPQHPPGTNPGDVDNPVSLHMAKKSSLHGTSRSSIVIVLVGCSQKGRAHLGARVQRYLHFFHAVETKMFVIPDEPADPSHCSKALAEHRTTQYEARLAELKNFLRVNGKETPVCGILDGRCVARNRRKWIREYLSEVKTARVLFVECDLMHEEPTTLSLANDMKIYETLTAEHEDCTWIRLQDGYRVTVNKPVHDVTMQIILFLMNVHNKSHVFYISRHGQSQYNLEGKIGGDSDLTENGEMYAKKLAIYAEKIVSKDDEGNYTPVRLWTSTLKRTNMTVKYIKESEISINDPTGRCMNWINFAHKQYRNLDEIYAGDCDGLTYREIQEQYPDEFARRQKYRLAYRYPRGESYLDLIQRLHPMILEMERLRENLLIVAHQAVIRMILAYWTNAGRGEAAQMSVPLNTVLKITCNPFDIKVEKINVMEMVDLDDAQHPIHRLESFKTSQTAGTLPPAEQDPPSH